jgi:hypothetical protein
MSEKLHDNKEYLAAEIAAGKTSRDIANTNRVSYKLVEINLTKYGIPFVSQVYTATN